VGSPPTSLSAGATRKDPQKPFEFRQPHKRVNWRRIRTLNVDRLVQMGDVATAMDLLEDTAYADLDTGNVYDLTEANLLKVRH